MPPECVYVGAGESPSSIPFDVLVNYKPTTSQPWLGATREASKKVGLKRVCLIQTAFVYIQVNSLNLIQRIFINLSTLFLHLQYVAFMCTCTKKWLWAGKQFRARACKCISV